MVARGTGKQGSRPRSASTLQIRSELFEHGIYPASKQHKLTAQALVTAFTNLNLLSSIDYKIKLHHWLEQAKRHMPGLTDSDATIFYLSYKALLEEVDAHPAQPLLDAPLSELQVDVRCFAVFMAL